MLKTFAETMNGATRKERLRRRAYEVVSACTIRQMRPWLTCGSCEYFRRVDGPKMRTKLLCTFTGEVLDRA